MPELSCCGCGCGTVVPGALVLALTRVDLGEGRLAGAPRRRNEAALRLLEAYRATPGRPRCCRLAPSCSRYALEAYAAHGFAAAGALTAWRLARCATRSRWRWL